MTDDLAVRKYLRDLSVALEIEFRQRIPNATAGPSILLASPGGKVYSVSVDDAGLLETNLVFDG